MDAVTQTRTRTLHRLDRTGDTVTEWHRADDFEVAAAKSVFDSLRGEGFMAYRIDGGDEGGGAVIKDFDPDAEQIIMAPPLVGG